MFIAMNRFRVAKGSEAAFEQVWISRDSHLDKVPGFVSPSLLGLFIPAIYCAANCRVNSLSHRSSSAVRPR